MTDVSAGDAGASDAVTSLTSGDVPRWPPVVIGEERAAGAAR